jgi:hypothetical protein
VSANDRLLQIVFEVLDEINETRPAQDRIAKDPTTPLVGGGCLDSLAMISLLVGVDERLQREFQTSVDVVAVMALPVSQSPLWSVDSLVAHLVGKVT